MHSSGCCCRSAGRHCCSALVSGWLGSVWMPVHGHRKLDQCVHLHQSQHQHTLLAHNIPCTAHLEGGAGRHRVLWVSPLGAVLVATALARSLAGTNLGGGRADGGVQVSTGEQSLRHTRHSVAQATLLAACCSDRNTGASTPRPSQRQETTPRMCSCSLLPTCRPRHRYTQTDQPHPLRRRPLHQTLRLQSKI